MSDSVEIPEGGDSPEKGGAVPSELESKLVEQAARLDEVLRAYSRLQQDHADFRRRLERERDRVLEVERGNIALALIEAVDELDRSIAAAPDECAPVVDGVRLIRDGLLRRVLTGGITRQSVVGEAFDPTLHEAMEMVACDRPEDDGRIVEEVRAGYRQGERVLRPAQVRVGRFGPPPAKFGHNASSGSRRRSPGQE